MSNKKIHQDSTNKPQVAVPLEWKVPEGLATPYATNMLVQIMESEFKIMFFEVKPPIILDATQSAPTKVIADCVGSVIVSPERLSKFIELLKKQLDKYNSLKETGDLPPQLPLE